MPSSIMEGVANFRFRDSTSAATGNSAARPNATGAITPWFEANAPSDAASNPPQNAGKVVHCGRYSFVPATTAASPAIVAVSGTLPPRSIQAVSANPAIKPASRRTSHEDTAAAPVENTTAPMPHSSQTACCEIDTSCKCKLPCNLAEPAIWTGHIGSVTVSHTAISCLVKVFPAQYIVSLYMTRRSILLLLLAASLQAQPRRDVVSLSSPLTETVYLLGQQDRLSIISDSSVFPEQAVTDRHANKFKVVSFGRPDLAQVEAAHPSLILTSTSFQRPIADALRKKGFKVLHFEPESMEDIFKQTEEIGKALGQGERAAEITRWQRADLALIAEQSANLPKVRVYMEINHNGPWTSGGKSVENEIIRLAGGENVFADGPPGAFQTTNAEVVKRNPDIILSPIWLDAHVGGMDGITTLVEISTRPGYADTTAVKNGRVLYYDSALLKQQGPREILAARKLAYLLHPDVFPNPAGTIPWELGRVRQ